MYLLIDECCGKGIVAVAQRQQHAVQRSIEVIGLGPGALDQAVFAFAQRAGAVVVTVNQVDYLELADLEPDHHGLMLLPSMSGVLQARIFSGALREAVSLIEMRRGTSVVMGGDGRAVRVR